MLILDTTSDVIQLVTSAAGAIDADASYSDLNAGTQTPASQPVAQITTAATTTIVAAPGASTQRNIKSIHVRNASVTVANAVTVQHFDGTRTSTYIQTTLQPGDSLVWTDVNGWQFVPNATAIVAPGQLIAVTLLTAASGTFTTGNFTTRARVCAVGGGGGGGGCTSVAFAAGGAGGGGSGGYGEKLFNVSPATGYSFVCGAAGAGNSAAAGGNGGDTTFGPVNGVTLTAKGGTGAAAITSANTLSASAGGAGGIAGSGGDINASGAPGRPGFIVVVGTPSGVGGSGGSSAFGSGGNSITTVGNGSPATGNGGGGGGGLTGASVARTGGAGTAGAIMVYEYS